MLKVWKRGDRDLEWIRHTCVDLLKKVKHDSRSENEHNLWGNHLHCLSTERQGAVPDFDMSCVKNSIGFPENLRDLTASYCQKITKFLPSELQPVYCIDNLDPFNTAQFITLVPGAAASFGLYAKASILGSSGVHAILMGVSMGVHQWKWFTSWNIPSINGWWLGVPPWLRKSQCITMIHFEW